MLQNNDCFIDYASTVVSPSHYKLWWGEVQEFGRAGYVDRWCDEYVKRVGCVYGVTAYGMVRYAFYVESHYIDEGIDIPPAGIPSPPLSIVEYIKSDPLLFMPGGIWIKEEQFRWASGMARLGLLTQILRDVNYQ